MDNWGQEFLSKSLDSDDPAIYPVEIPADLNESLKTPTALPPIPGEEQSWANQTDEEEDDSDADYSEDDQIQIPHTRRLSGGSDSMKRAQSPSVSYRGIPLCDSKCNASATKSPKVAFKQYEAYLKKIDNEPIIPAVRSLMYLGSIHNETAIKGAWKSVGKQVEKWMQDSDLPSLSVFLSCVKLGPQAFESFVTGYQMGAESKTAKESSKVVEELASIMEVINVSYKEILEAKKAHESQSIDFAKQVNGAAAAINASMKAVEDHHLSLVKAETHRPPIPRSIVSYDNIICSDKRAVTIADEGTTSGSSSSEPADPYVLSQKVEEIQGDGTYESEFAVVKIVRGRVSSVDCKSPGSEPLKNLIGLKSAVAEMFLNRNMKAIIGLGQASPKWLDALSGPIDQDVKDHYLSLTSKITRGTYQWKRLSCGQTCK